MRSNSVQPRTLALFCPRVAKQAGRPCCQTRRSSGRPAARPLL